MNGLDWRKQAVVVQVPDTSEFSSNPSILYCLAALIIIHNHTNVTRIAEYNNNEYISYSAHQYGRTTMHTIPLHGARWVGTKAFGYCCIRRSIVRRSIVSSAIRTVQLPLSRIQ